MPAIADETRLPLKGSPLAALRAAGQDLAFRWGGPLDDAGKLAANVRAAHELSQAWLSSEDSRLLRLLAERATPFAYASSLIELMYTFNELHGSLSETWVEELLAFLPDVPDSDADQQKSTSDKAHDLVSRGYAPPLAATLLLTLHSEYWPRQLRKLGVHNSIATFFSSLLGDLEFFSHGQLNGNPWNDGHYEAYYDLVEVYTSCWRGTSERLHCQRVTEHFEIMARAAGDVILPIGAFFNTYDEWIVQRVAGSQLAG